MPGVPMHCLNTIQPIVGCDGHRAIPPPSPVPPYAPHVVIWGVGFSESFSLPLSKATSKAARGAGANASCTAGGPVRCGWGYAVGRQHDAGPWAVHIWPNVLLPLILFGAGNKAEFSAGTVKIPTGTKAVAVAFVCNLDLDCWDFPVPPLPTSAAIAAANPVFGGFTWGDFFGGLAGMLLDMAVTWAIGAVAGVVSGGLGAGIDRLLGRTTAGWFANVFKGPWASTLFTEEAPGFFRRFGQFGVDAMSRSTMRAAAANWARGVSGPASTVVGTALSQLIGTPLGYAHPDTPVGGQRQGGWNDGVHDSLRDLF